MSRSQETIAALRKSLEVNTRKKASIQSQNVEKVMASNQSNTVRSQQRKQVGSNRKNILELEVAGNNKGHRTARIVVEKGPNPSKCRPEIKHAEQVLQKQKIATASQGGSPYAIASEGDLPIKGAPRSQRVSKTIKNIFSQEPSGVKNLHQKSARNVSVDRIQFTDSLVGKHFVVNKNSLIALEKAQPQLLI